ncbi:MAG: ATPase, T2SS/T4P/T4SS family, partial [Acidimicrobiia bacterium]
MKLSERLKQQAGDAPESLATNTVSRNHTEERDTPANDDPLAQLKARAQTALMVRMGPALFDTSLSAVQLDNLVVAELGQVLRDEKIPLTPGERDKLVSSITDQVLGYGPIERYLDDPTVSEIMVNSLDGVYVERNGRLELTDAAFLSHDHILRVIDRIVAPIGRRIDETSPMVDGRLPDGSRVNAIIPPLALDGPVLTVRKFPAQAFELDDLVEMGTITDRVGTFLAACVEGRANILVSGGTGTGKTTLLNVLSGMIPETERIVTIEDAAELQLHQNHVLRLEARPPNIEGRGEVKVRDLVRNSLRMRPDRIVVG